MVRIHARQKAIDEQTLLSKGYTALTAIGAGAFGRVYKCKTRQNKVVAVKIINGDKFDQKEVDIAVQLSKKNSPYLSGVTKSMEAGDYYLIESEFANGGSLQSILDSDGVLQEQKAKRIIEHTLRGLLVLHAEKMIHRDIKPDNILLDVPEGAPNVIDHAIYKLTDFGISRVADAGGLAQTSCGTPPYMAPEILLSEDYDNKCDIWSCGVMLFELMTGQLPFRGQVPSLVQQWLKPPPEVAHASPEGADLLK
ncbi:putative serine/threonine protein kinase [Blattamonas nauphoetae]|uniref:Serine/threonine protein kinase n=1 Tax=Blattamonas nauphoetae TaxID=2049346 RepID=A0ABQ9WUE7_9EUKA|nr:putative serine/threonine protein kinase [Blattamonas nauphoetae]